jgi:TPP-dependent pyruvate/acetoin dehydrogenase alpha subunit
MHERVFFCINAAGVLQVPLIISVWDDYGISVHAKHQTTKENISDFKRIPKGKKPMVSKYLK